MCVAVIKRSSNPLFSYFIGFNRDEAIGRSWETWDYHWENFPDIYGLLDVESGGTWLARNDNGVVAFVINREASNSMELSNELMSRAEIVLKALDRARTAEDAIKQLGKVDNIKPFNFIAVDKTNVMYFTNTSSQLAPHVLNDDLIIVNRSCPNDFNEVRVKSNFNRFKLCSEPNPYNHDYSDWRNILIETCFTTTSNSEITMSLVSDNWKTLSSSIVSIRSDSGLPDTVNII